MLVPRAKITMPRLPSEFVKRSDLCAGLDAGAVDVALLCAPAGYGKTVLLADWARTSTTTDTAWVSLDRDDNDPRRLWSSIVAAIAGCPSVPPSSRVRTRGTWQPTARPEFVTELAESLQALPHPVRLVLDDVHEIVDPQTLHAVETFIRVKPATVRLVLASRLDPPLSLPRLRLAGRLWELRAAQMSFTRDQAAALLAASGLQLLPAQVDLLHDRTGGWAAGLRLAALGMAESTDLEAFLAEFSGDDRSVADYLVGEILSGLPPDVQEFLRVISISDPVPAGLAAELSERDEAGSVLDRLEHQTFLVTATGPRRETYRVQELLRTHLLADLHRQGVRRIAGLHAQAARWWAGQDQPLRALEHATESRDPALVTDLLHRFAVRLILAGAHGPLRRAMAGVEVRARTADPRLSLASALTHVEAGEFTAAQTDVRHARRSWPADPTADLAVLRAVAEQFGGGADGATAWVIGDVDELPSEPELEALARLGRGNVQLAHADPTRARVEFDAALTLSRRHAYDYLAMQSLALLGIVAANTGDLRAMRKVSDEALVIATDHGWEGSIWWAAATAMVGSSDLLDCEPGAAERRTADALGRGLAGSTPPLRFMLRVVHGAAVFDLGDRAAGLAEMQQARSDFGDGPAAAEQHAAAAMLEYRAALLLGHSAAARTVLGWLIERTGDSAEANVMQAWAHAAGGRPEHARGLIRTVLDGAAPVLVPCTAVDAWLLETSMALALGERPAARNALRTALAVAELLGAVRPFAQAGPSVRELLVHQHGSFGASGAFADRALAVGARREQQNTVLSEREITVLGLLPSLLSLDEIAVDLTVSVNTVKSHVRSIYTKLGVSSRRLAVLAAHERGLLHSSVR